MEKEDDGYLLREGAMPVGSSARSLPGSGYGGGGKGGWEGTVLKESDLLTVSSSAT